MLAPQKERDITAGTLNTVEGTQNHLENPKNRLREPKITKGTQNPIVGTQKLILGKKDAREGKVGIWELETPNPLLVLSSNFPSNQSANLKQSYYTLCILMRGQS